MNKIKLSNLDSALLLDTTMEDAYHTLGRAVLLAGNEDTETLIKGVELALNEQENPCSHYISTLNFEDNWGEFKEERLIEILSELLLEENTDAYKVILNVFHEEESWFGNFAIERDEIVIQSELMHSDVSLYTRNSDFRAVFSALLNTFATKNGVVVIKDFNTQCWSWSASSQELLIEAMLTLAEMSSTRLILVTDRLGTVTAFKNASTKLGAKSTLATLQDNTVDNCPLMQEAEMNYKKARMIADGLGLLA